MATAIREANDAGAGPRTEPADVADEAVRGVGLGLRTEHYRDILEGRPDVPFFEVLTDNYAHADGPPLHFLELIRADYPAVFHGVGMSLGSVDPLDRDYLRAVRALADRFEPTLISEHLAWTSVDGEYFHELLPLPYNAECVNHVAARIRQVQDTFGRGLLVENTVGYLAFAESDLSEQEFVCAVLEEADCQLLLDVNNVHVNAYNHGFDPLAFIDAIPPERVAQMHLAGYEDRGDVLIDTHGAPVSEPVWTLFEQAVRRFPGVPVCIEWDADIPPFAVLEAERRRANEAWSDACGRARGHDAAG
jgi:uncharacterized protein (UPF0276 family)